MTPFALLLFFIVSANTFRSPYYIKSKYIQVEDDGGDPGSPLFLTPYIEKGNIEEARNLSYVEFPNFPDIKSYAGFFTVDKTYNSNQFFWYFPAEQERTGDLKSAVYVWLQGGPGVSSLFGLFSENGVFELKNNTFQQRELYWSKNDHVIYIDNPVGAGFSFTNDDGYCTNQTQVGEHLYSTLLQFFQLFPELQKYDFIISGESYAGKYVPALGYTIHKKNPTAKVQINLKGLMIGDGFSDPVNQLDYAAFVYQIGLIDWHVKKKLEDLQAEAVKQIQKEAWSNASYSVGKMLALISDLGGVSIYNFLKNENEMFVDDYTSLLEKTMYRKAIHVGNLSYSMFNAEVNGALSADMYQSVAPWITELLEHYHMLFYNGQSDIIVAYPLTLNFLRKLKFSGSEDYLKAPRQLLLYETSSNVTVVGGYMKAAENGKLMDAMVRVAGHMVPTDQPGAMLALMDAWRRHYSKSAL